VHNPIVVAVSGLFDQIRTRGRGTDGIPNVCECICDVFRDFNVNGIDLGVLLGQWGPANQFTVTDFNQGGSVDGVDLGILLGAWGPCPN